MEKRVIGVILTLLGIIGVVMAGVNFVNSGGGTNHNVRAIMVYGILGLLFFFAGIGLIRSTRDIAKNNEHIS